MNCEQIKSTENGIIVAIKNFSLSKEIEDKYIDFAEKCFEAQRVEYLQETRIRNLEGFSRNLELEISRHKACISNLRGYIDYLEKEKQILEDKLNEE